MGGSGCCFPSDFLTLQNISVRMMHEELFMLFKLWYNLIHSRLFRLRNYLNSISIAALDDVFQGNFFFHGNFLVDIS